MYHAELEKKFSFAFKLELWCQFHQHFTCACLYKNELSSFSLITFGLCNIWRQNIGAKCARKMLMKSTHGKDNIVN